MTTAVGVTSEPTAALEPDGSKPPHVRTTPGMLGALLDRRRSIGMFERLAAGRTGVVALSPMGRRVWLVFEPPLAREILVESARSVTKGEGLRMVRWVLGDGLLTSTDAVTHRRNRRLIQPAFSAAKIAAYADVMVAAAERMNERWTAGSVVEMPAEMAALTLDVVGQTLLGDDTAQDAHSISESLETVLKRFGVMFFPGSERLLASRLPIAVQIREATASMRATVERIIDRHRGSDSIVDDMVASLLAARDDGDALTDEQVRDETLTLLLAGHETTANALTWAWWLLDREPRAAARLHRELADVLGDRRPSYDDMSALPYTTAVIAETMRLRPPAWMIERETLEPVRVGEYVAPVGTTLLASPWLLHHDPRSWGEDAARFRPERWLGTDGGFDPTAPGQPRGAYLPFGAGNRICIGESFAWAEAVLILATLARHWAPATEPGQRVGTWAAVTLRPHPGIRMRLVST
ncbi:MAG TPA: cytochrome P450 [Mycobacteriales bacterium]|nr:cytochrome P450 [Mycobacteriales bacterium]